MNPPTIGTWLVECTIGDYQLAGMRAKLLVYDPSRFMLSVCEKHLGIVICVCDVHTVYNLVNRTALFHHTQYSLKKAIWSQYSSDTLLI